MGSIAAHFGFIVGFQWLYLVMAEDGVFGLFILEEVSLLNSFILVYIAGLGLVYWRARDIYSEMISYSNHAVPCKICGNQTVLRWPDCQPVGCKPNS